MQLWTWFISPPLNPSLVSMEKPSTSSKFQFRDHQEMDNSALSDTSSEISSVSSDAGDESELQSMTAKGIKRLCSELLELKAESDEDFHRNIFVHYPTFVRIFEEAKRMENQLMLLKGQVTLQRRLVKGLIDDISVRVLSTKSIDLAIEDSVTAELSARCEIEDHITNISETLDMLLAENKIDEAITVLEMEEENFQRLQYDDNCSSDVLVQYDSAISERKATLTSQLTLVAENPRIAAPELQMTLVGLCRLGESHLATQLLLMYYQSRIATGIHNFQSSKSFLHGVYIRELSKFVFSMISQAARSFVMLYGETSPYAPEFIQWASEEIEVFVVYFNKYVKPISEISGGMSKAVQAVQYAMSFCSLLETQRLALRPFLIKQIRPCLEEVLQMHIDHFKKVISIVSAADSWVLGRYLVSRIINQVGSSVAVEQKEYFLLTNSGRKFVMLLQAIIADITPLVSVQMEVSVFRGLMDLIAEYVVILERAINSETNFAKKGCSRIILAESLSQQVSVLANLSTLEYFFSRTVRSIFRDINQSVGFQQRDFDSSMLFIYEANGRLRAHFCQQLIYQKMYPKTGSEHAPEPCTVNAGDRSILCNVMPMPSAAFQALFFELRTLNKLAEENVFELDWLMELMRELVETVLLWISNNKEIWALTEENLSGQNSDVYDQEQFILDVHFLIEIARDGGYFSDDCTVLATLMNSAFRSAGLDPQRYVDGGEWAKYAAIKAIQRLTDIQQTKSLLKDELIATFEEQHENQIKYASDSFQDDSRISSELSLVSEKDELTIDKSEVAINTQTTRLNSDSTTPFDGIVEEAFEGRVSLEEGASCAKCDAVEFMISKLEDDAEIELSGFETTCTDDPARL